MKYLSVCSGIEAATVAWHHLGWKPLGFSEVDKFPCEVLKHHYPDVPNFGDMTKYMEWKDANVDILVGGTPCQSFSVAGLRKGLDDPRGNLMLTYLAIAAKYQPKWILWENVPGVLSSNKGLDFAAFLTGMGECGYGFAYRVLDAQYVRTDGHPYAVPQRRRRVFVVGHLGSWQRAAAVLFDSESVSRNSTPSRKARKDITQVAGTLSANCGGLNRPAGNANELDFCIATHEIAGTMTANKDSGGFSNSVDHAAGGYMAIQTTCSGKKTFGTLMANCGTKQWLGNQEALSGDYHVFALADNTIGREPLNGGNGNGFDDAGVSYTLTKADVHAVAFKVRGGCEGGGKGYLGSEDSAFTLSTNQDQHLFNQMRVRRLTPKECARLQGFPDDYLSQVPGATDSAMYKALGNSMAVNVMQLLGERIQMVDDIK